MLPAAPPMSSRPAGQNFPENFSPPRQGLTPRTRPTTVMRMTTPDEDLARAAAGGDARAFGVLIERVYDRLFALCLRLMANRAEAEDLTQDICAALPAKLASFRGDAAFRSWLHRVAINAAHDRRRRHATHARAAEGWGDWECARRAAIAATAEGLSWLEAALAQLPEDLRDTAALVLDDATHAEAAATLGLSEGTVSWRMSEVRRRLTAMKNLEESA